MSGASECMGLGRSSWRSRGEKVLSPEFLNSQLALKYPLSKAEQRKCRASGKAIPAVRPWLCFPSVPPTPPAGPWNSDFSPHRRLRPGDRPKGNVQEGRSHGGQTILPCYRPAAATWKPCFLHQTQDGRPIPSNSHGNQRGSNMSRDVIHTEELSKSGAREPGAGGDSGSSHAHQQLIINQAAPGEDKASQDLTLSNGSSAYPR
ncbi:uncharacterized protein LOC129456340 [Periophthalmus magnuspinnatus]|uniref:uncharacterized protein LOC129456340 n=1 Tax=Periophthalmus magnuspinnatus TaxID=409849 RepID=UPI0024362C93|nr:uncharacterized protein LOC129456340 [Periophthalmus magnuspinnatus]